MNKIPDQSGEVEIRLRVMPWLHDAVMAYGREHGVRSTTERYCLALTHLLRLIGKLPEINGINMAICGNDAGTIERAKRALRAGVSLEEFLQVSLRIGSKHFAAMDFIDPLAEAEEIEKAG